MRSLKETKERENKEKENEDFDFFENEREDFIKYFE